ncbi:tRNA (cytidine(34)-2'-O)-methyltransferase [Chitiniphilus eburneus]|uniref:tRNA (cytidine(34)-2'-O)-methyltransferase n=1 Tax=Chitiniphilus eburneus TaxID=2571148 RepID=A0A4U0PY19_9NEIS|nr:tRNA (cytidine(34)-2'-O)-methyltransferase [Chitiniphilus eburneus]TJZ73503.1 tRNA (cytidine(34)-2'-O)-methyltransferase [Chitiniphilus eburneus]
MFHIVLFQPEIPPNTGNVIRLVANTGCVLHLVKPLGFELDDARLRRAGLDYHEYATLQVHEDWAAAQRVLGDRRCFAMTTRSSAQVDGVAFADEDVFVFGPETRGLPQEMLDRFPPEARIRLPMLPGQRSLNLSNAVAVTVFEAWRQLGYPGSV